MTVHPKEDSASRASLELLFHISKELSSALDLSTVLRRVLLLSMWNIGAVNGSLIVLDAHGQPIESAIIVGDVIHDHTTQRLRSMFENGLAGWVVRNRKAALVGDSTKDKRWLTRVYKIDEQTYPKSVVSAPLMIRDVVVGVITLVQPEPDFFTSEHLALIQTIADQAAIAVLNARYYAESQHQAKVMTALAETASRISLSLELDDVLQDIVEQTSHTLNSQSVSLALIDFQEGLLQFRASTGRGSKKIGNTRFKMGQGIAGWVAQQGEGVIIQDVEKDQRFDPDIDRLTRFIPHVIACSPITYRGEVIGVIEALNPGGGFYEPDTLLLMSGIGSLAGTAIKHAQLFTQLQEANQSYRELFENSIDPIFITDWEGNILRINHQASVSSGYLYEDLYGMKIDRLFSQPEDLLGEKYSNLHNGSTITFEGNLSTQLGNHIPIQVFVRQVQLETTFQIQWTLRDISERKKLDSLRNDLTSMIYHDLRSPLANIVSSLDVIDTMISHDEENRFKPMIDIAMRSTTRIQRLIDSLLDMERLESGKEIGIRQPCSASMIIQEALDIERPIFLNKSQIVQLEVQDRLPSFLADADMIKRVIINLLENAAKFTQQNGTIIIGADRDGDVVRFWVNDNGPGIPVSEHESIFNKYNRIEQSGAPTGMGLGLAYCRLAVQSHGGKIWVESKPGNGSRFIFTLPIAK